MKADFTDDVSGQIVGTHYGAAWVTYEGRKQGKTFYVSTESEALKVCSNHIENYKSMPVGKDIYPDDSAWRICMDGV